MLTLRAPSWPRRKTVAAEKENRSEREYVRREELVAAAREVGWEPFSCEEIRAVTLER